MLPPVIEHRNWHPASLLDGAGTPDIRRMSQWNDRLQRMNKHGVSLGVIPGLSKPRQYRSVAQRERPAERLR